jgi:hypothetical protein
MLQRDTWRYAESVGKFMRGSTGTAAGRLRLVWPVGVRADEGAHNGRMRDAEAVPLLSFDEPTRSEEGHREAHGLFVDAVVAG